MKRGIYFDQDYQALLPSRSDSAGRLLLLGGCYLMVVPLDNSVLNLKKWHELMTALDVI
jgi:hypothetical protein